MMTFDPKSNPKILGQTPPESFLPPPELSPSLKFTDTILPDRFNIGDQLMRNKNPDDVCIYFGNESLTYKMVDELSNQFGDALRKLGVHKGDRLILMLPNLSEFMYTWIGIVKIGAIVVPASPSLAIKEIQGVQTETQAQIILLENKSLKPEMLNIFHYIISIDGNTENSVINFKSFLQSGNKTLDIEDTSGDDIASLFYTSGSTSTPKACIHTHRTLLTTGIVMTKLFHVGPNDVLSGSSPLGWIYALLSWLITPLYAGASTVVAPITSSQSVIDIISKYKITVYFTYSGNVRSIVQLLLENPSALETISSLKILVTSGDTVPAAIFNKWNETVKGKIPLIVAMGTTEMGAIIFSNRLNDTKAGSTGKIAPGFEVKLVDDNFNDVPTGQIGKLLVRGYSGVSYWGTTEKQKKQVWEGWTIIDDLLYVDEEGYYYFQGREIDVFKFEVKNEKGMVFLNPIISPLEIENVLLQHPLASLAIVVGVDDETYGQYIKAFIIPNDLDIVEDDGRKQNIINELKALLKEQMIYYKHPKEYEFVRTLPIGPTGKIVRKKLRELANSNPNK